MPKKRTIAIFPSMATSGLPRLRLLIMIPRRFSRSEPLFTPFATQYSGYYMNRDGRSSFSFSVALSRPVITKLAFRGRWWVARDGRGREEGGKRRTCAREALSFSSARSFPAAFPSPVPPFLAVISFQCRAKSQRQWKYVALYSPQSVRRSFVWMFWLFDMSGDMAAHEMIADPTKLSDLLLKINM